LVNSQAIAAPMPVPPPMTIATLFDSLIDAFSESAQTQQGHWWRIRLSMRMKIFGRP
jgi:hypothetical protein